jgi:hypothetical protein
MSVFGSQGMSAVFISHRGVPFLKSLARASG